MISFTTAELEAFIATILWPAVRVLALFATAPVLSHRTAFKRPSFDPGPVGPTSWRAQNENPWANAYGTPSSPASKYSTVSRVTASTTYHVCTCYIPADARSWDGGPLTQADVARRCQAQCP